jgi:hypothetical protein
LRPRRLTSQESRFKRARPVSWSRRLTRQLLSPKLHTAGNYRCAGLEGYVVPEVIRERRSVLPQLGQTV